MQTLYMTIISATHDRKNVTVDMPTHKPNPGEFDQHVVINEPSGKYEIQFYGKGMNYSEDDILKLVTILMTEPITRYGMIKPRIVVLDEDLMFNAMLIVDDLNEGHYLVVRTQSFGEEITLDPNPIRAKKEEYPLDGLFAYWKAAGFERYELPGDSADARMYAVVHPSSRVDWQGFATGVMQFLFEQGS